MKNNYFALLNLPMTLPVDLAMLNSSYLTLQKMHHPDNFATANDAQKMIAMQTSTTLNEALQVLKNPIKAAEHILSLNNINALDEHNIIHDADFLMTQFALREQLDDIASKADFSELDDFYNEILKQKHISEDLLYQDINQQNWQAATTQILKIRYQLRLLEQIEQLQDNM